ncbi:hypothetical protein OIU79_030611 [Salix purpurea]|uniref:Uncharacterized protein n=1 Tax=Salix purpurea TaxID=77065 RepID=A0A9Q0VB10_SALPP|nr:hypothetical protein OIU79_030611 [Salix purpurea]
MILLSGRVGHFALPTPARPRMQHTAENLLHSAITSSRKLRPRTRSATFDSLLALCFQLFEAPFPSQLALCFRQKFTQEELLNPTSVMVQKLISTSGSKRRRP